MDSQKQNLCLAPDQKMVGTKKLQMIKKPIWHHNIFWSFFVKKRRSLLFPKIPYDIAFPQKMVPECKPEWNR